RRPLWYQWLFSGIEVFFEEYYRNKLDGLTAISHALMERAVNLGVERERCLVIPGGAPVRAFSKIPNQAQSRRMLGIAEDVPVVCFSGLDVLIDLPMAVKAYEILRVSDPRTMLLLVGPTERDVKGMVSSRDSLNGIKAVGPIAYKDLPSYLSAADVFLMPYTQKVSNVGRWPNKIGDYMCVGRPTVSNPVGEVKWLFERYPIGSLCEETPEGMAATARDYLNDGERCVRVGMYAREVAEKVFAWDKLIVGLENWYYALVEGRLGARVKSATSGTPLLVHQPANGAGIRR
ncbi:MAG: glycosyltransferase, partial [Candidatus Hydrogenedentes bacterium]|nr:glycosyltransferase [Candidatus Hydrogenedentota bacterium]